MIFPTHVVTLFFRTEVEAAIRGKKSQESFLKLGRPPVSAVYAEEQLSYLFLLFPGIPLWLMVVQLKNLHVRLWQPVP